jgi:hypothetical protein
MRKGVAVPFADPRLPWRTEQSVREQDRIDRKCPAHVLEDHER